MLPIVLVSELIYKCIKNIHKKSYEAGLPEQASSGILSFKDLLGEWLHMWTVDLMFLKVHEED